MFTLPKSLFASAAVLVLCAAQTIAATSVSDGDINVALTPEAAAPANGGAIIFDTLNAFTFGSGASTVTGNLQSRVFINNTTLTNTFAYRIRDLNYTPATPGAFAPLTTLTVSGFSAFGALDVFSLTTTTSLGQTPITSVSRSGGAFSFDISGLTDQSAGTSESGSTFFGIRTDATFFSAGDFGEIWDGTSGMTLDNVAAPVNPVPLPAGGTLLVVGLAGLAALRRRKV